MFLDSLARLLAAAGVGDYATDRELNPDLTPIALYGMPPTEGAAVVLSTYGGPEPDSRNGWEYPRLQVRVRAHDPMRALELDRAVFDELQALAHITLTDGTYLQDCYALQSTPLPMGQDRSGRWEYSRNYQLTTLP